MKLNLHHTQTNPYNQYIFFKKSKSIIQKSNTKVQTCTSIVFITLGNHKPVFIIKNTYKCVYIHTNNKPIIVFQQENKPSLPWSVAKQSIMSRLSHRACWSSLVTRQGRTSPFCPSCSRLSQVRNRWWGHTSQVTCIPWVSRQKDFCQIYIFTLFWLFGRVEQWFIFGCKLLLVFKMQLLMLHLLMLQVAS